FGQQLLVGGNRHKRVADFVGEPVGHVFDQAQVGGFNFQAVQLFGLRMVFDDQERRVGNAGAVALEGDDRDLVHRIGGIGRRIGERSDRRAGFEDLINPAAEHLGKVAELEFVAPPAGPREIPARNLVGMEDGQVAANDDTAVAQFVQDVDHHLVVAGQLVMEPNVANRQSQRFEQVKHQFQFRVGERIAGQTPMKRRDADQSFAIQNRNGHLNSQQFKFLLDFLVALHLAVVSPQDAPLAIEVSADAGFEAQLKVLQQTGRNAHGANGAQPPVLRAGRGFAEAGRELAQKHDRAVYADDFAQQEQELLEQSLGIQRMSQNT